MRISIDQNDAGYVSYKDMKRAGKNVRVFLDGIEEENCITADDVAGEVLRYEQNQVGGPIERPRNLDRPNTEVVKGAVRLEFWTPLPRL